MVQSFAGLLSMLRRITLPRLVRLFVTIAATGSITLLLGIARSSFNSIPTNLDELTPLERYYVHPNETGNVLNPHPFDVLIDPGSHVCSDSHIYLIVYVHSAPNHGDRRTVIRNTWGNKTQFDLAIRVVFVMGLTPGNNTVDEQLVAESERYQDIIQENFIDTYYNITYKAVAALRWVSQRCPQAEFVLKTDDDAFVNMHLLLKLLVRMSTVEPSLRTKTIMCNLWRDEVPRDGKWKLERSVFRFHYYPAFCQGLAYIMTQDMIVPLYNASYYVPFLQMDDVYLTGFVMLRIEGAKHVEMNSFYVRNDDLLTFIKGDQWMQYLYSHIKSPMDIESFWNAAKQVTWDAKSS